MPIEINWMEEVNKRKSSIIEDTQKFLQIKSVLDENETSIDAPLGVGIAKALQFLLNKGENDGFIVKNLNGLAGHIEYGTGKELIGILCHVDVVPEGDGWTSDPYGAEIRENKIFARGAIDDKGPTIAAYYALKIVKELGEPFQKRVRIILGTDEESNWRCVDHYFKHEEMPTMGFAPDADFPIINAEKGILDFTLTQHFQASGEQGEIVLQSFQAGRRLNMVPDMAVAILECKTEKSGDLLKEQFVLFLQNNNVKGKAVLRDHTVELKLEGISAHGMEPNNGKNAGLLLNQFLAKQHLDNNGTKFSTFVNQYLGQETRGHTIGIAFEDQISGELTINCGILSYDRAGIGEIGLNLRYPVSHKIEESKKKIIAIAEGNGFSYTELDDSKPHYVDEQTPFIQILKKVYEQQTGGKAELLAIGGGTYARSLTSGVAFGPLFPGRPDVAHQKDEYIEIEDLLRATAIYAQAIYELVKN
ncbi:dipeptidase PepV [Calidifontibacillus oryziterrae]|uniref:dipeptidase PepV n=1 Tax=Calidifontibacillus oryziterrae TaxID=1191699 RepID=UPI0002F6A37E|nr:dipeptidase PepV [Calidifontibacillus oryziterrae]